jgi:hypothetical protein
VHRRKRSAIVRHQVIRNHYHPRLKTPFQIFVPTQKPTIMKTRFAAVAVVLLAITLSFAFANRRPAAETERPEVRVTVSEGIAIRD